MHIYREKGGCKKMDNSHEDQLKKRICELESLNDQLSSELRYLDLLLKEVGFEEGLVTLKFAALELLEQDGGEEEN